MYFYFLINFNFMGSPSGASLHLNLCNGLRIYQKIILAFLKAQVSLYRAF